MAKSKVSLSWLWRKKAIFPLLYLAVFGVALGANEPKFADVPTDPNAPIKTPANITNLVNEILFWFSTIFWIAAVGFVFYAAYLYLTGGGSDEKLKQAKKQLLYAVIAIAVGLMAQGLPALIKAFLSLGGGGGSGGSGGGV